MKVKIFEGTPEEYKVVAHLFADAPSSEKTSPNGAVAGSVVESLIDPKEAIRAMLKRRHIPNGQRALYKALADGEVHQAELLKKTGKTAAENAGVLGALGRRINNTKEIHEAGLPEGVNAMINYRRMDDGLYFLSLTPDADKVLREEGII